MKSRYYSPLMSFLLVLLVSLSACSGSKKANVSEDPEKEKINQLFKNVGHKQVDAEWLDAKARVKYADDNMKIGLTANFRMKKDSVVWASMRKLGFEVARVLIRPDSVFVLDRINNEYMAKDLKAIKDYIDIPADFSVIQSLVLGNLVLFTSRPPTLEIVEEKFQLSTDDALLRSNYLISKDYLLENMTIEDKRSAQEIEINFDAYESISSNKNFSYIRNLTLRDEEKTSAILDVKFSKVEFNIPKDIRFEVPKKYTKVD